MSLQVNDIKSFSFFESNSITLNNLAQNAVVIESDAIPTGHIARLQDVNTIFTTSGGTLAYEKVSRSGGVTRFAASITSNSNGSFDMMFMEGDRARIVLTATGNGVIDVLWHGELQRVRPEDTRNIFTFSDEFGNDL